MASNRINRLCFCTALIILCLMCSKQVIIAQPFFQQATFSLPARISLGNMRSAYVPSQHSIYILGGYEPLVGFSDKIIKIDLNLQQASYISTQLPFSTQDELTQIQVTYNNIDGRIYFFKWHDVFIFDPTTEQISLIGPSASPELVTGAGIAKHITPSNLIYLFGYRGSAGGNFTLKFDPLSNVMTQLTSTLQPNNNGSPAAAYCQTNGLIYLFGGNWSSWSFDIIQKFDPISESFTTLPVSLPTISGGASAVAVTNENAIYVFGGFDNSVNLVDVSKFDCSTETLQQMTNLPIALSHMGTEYVPSENRIYILGGVTARTGGYAPATDAVYYLQLQAPPPPLDTSDVTIQWVPATPFTEPHGAANVEVINRKIYLPGGGNGQVGGYNFSPLSIYDVDTDSWSQGQNMPSPKAGNSGTTVLNGLFYHIGGEGPNAGRWSPETEEYNPSSDQWSLRANWPSRRRDIAVASFDNDVYAIGGQPSYFSMSSSVDIYDPDLNTWGNGPSLPINLSGASAITFDDSLYVFGGYTGPDQFDMSHSDRVFVLKPGSAVWEELGHMPYPRARSSIGIYNGKIYFIGGERNNENYWNEPFEDIWEYSPSEDKFRQVLSEDFIIVVGNGTHAAVVDNEIFYIGTYLHDEINSSWSFYPSVQRGQFSSPELPPIAHAGQDSTYECTSPSGAQVSLNASLSSDPDNDILTFTWRENGNIIAGPTTDPISLVTLSLGNHQIELTVEDGNGGTDTDDVVITVLDTTPPTITLNGDNTLPLECGMPYEEPGATVTDLCDTNPTLEISGVVDTTTCGSYTVTYTTTDSSDNSSVATRTINVVDTTPPTITLNGANPLMLMRFSGPYTEPGAVVTDNCDPNPSLVISGSVDTNLPGQYTITYDASDAKDNTSQATRTIHVIDDPNALEHPFLYLADKKIMLDKMIQSQGDMHSNDEIDIKKGPTTYISDIAAVGKIDIAKNITIEGDVTAGGELQLDKNVNITGFAQEYANVTAISLPSLSFGSGGNDIKVKKNKTKALSPGSYGKIEVEKKATLQLSSGEYFFEELKMKQMVKFEIDLATGPVTINVVKKVDMDKDVTMSISPLGENDSRYVVFNSLEDIQVDKGSVLLGTLNAPFDKVQLKKDVYLRGSICSEEIDIDKDVTALHHDVGIPLSKSITPIFVVDDIEENEEQIEEIAVLPETFELLQNYPNPFNPTTTISFALPEATSVTLKIYNTAGQLVRTLISSQIAAGFHNMTWNATDDNGVRVASGMYLYVLKAGQNVDQKKLLLMK